MSGICISVTKNCYALAWSYGQICCGTNCCGRYGKGLKMWKARLEYHESCLNEELNFNNWQEGYEELQRKNVKENIKYERLKIRQ